MRRSGGPIPPNDVFAGLRWSVPAMLDACEPVLLVLRTAEEGPLRIGGLLRGLGYRVLDAIEPHRLAGPARPGFGLAIIDLVLVSPAMGRSPGLSGILTRLMMAWPDLPVIVLPSEPPSPPPCIHGDALDALCNGVDAIILASAERRAASALRMRAS
ncbi:hypothetical protein [Methylobacterium sp. ID0610]|uniref:hypothetical protein n=1 Tax=Methylobacterium carpenticola TaxID=3344827 RepID=UPI00367D8907